jgi:hypothetical protein
MQVDNTFLVTGSITIKMVIINFYVIHQNVIANQIVQCKVGAMARILLWKHSQTGSQISIMGYRGPPRVPHMRIYVGFADSLFLASPHEMLPGFLFCAMLSLSLLRRVSCNLIAWPW